MSFQSFGAVTENALSSIEKKIERETKRKNKKKEEE